MKNAPRAPAHGPGSTLITGALAIGLAVICTAYTSTCVDEVCTRYRSCADAATAPDACVGPNNTCAGALDANGTQHSEE